MNIIKLLELMDVSVSNKANVKCIIKKLFDRLKLNELDKRTINKAQNIIDIVKGNYSSKKWVEVMGYVLKASILMKCKASSINAYREAMKELKNNHLSNYNRDRVYVKDEFKAKQGQLEQFLKDKDPIKQRIANLSYYLGGTRKGELLNCKITDYENIPDDVQHNCFNIMDKKFYIIYHKTKAHTGTRIIELNDELINEVRQDVGHYLIENPHNHRSISPNTYQKVFKSMLDINPLEFRHLHAVHNTKQPPQKQQEEANKLGHSLTTSHFIYANGLTNKYVSQASVQDALKYYEQLKEQFEEQERIREKLTITFD